MRRVAKRTLADEVSALATEVRRLRAAILVLAEPPPVIVHSGEVIPAGALGRNGTVQVTTAQAGEPDSAPVSAVEIEVATQMTQHDYELMRAAANKSAKTFAASMDEAVYELFAKHQVSP